MADHGILDAVLDNTQVPHQPLVVIVDSAVFSGLPLFRESLRRALNKGGPVLLVSALHDAESLNAGGATVVSLGVPGYANTTESEAELEQRILGAYTPGAQVYIDALDIIAADDSPQLALKLIRGLLRLIKSAKPPSRLTLLLPHTSPILAPLHQPTLSPALTLLYPYRPLVLSHLSRSYLLPISASPQLWTVLDRARARHLPEKLAYGGLDGVEVAADWSVPAPSSSSSATYPGGAIIGVLVRKPTGGVKGISRALVALTPAPNGIGLGVRPVDDLVSVSPINAPGAGMGPAVVKPATTHVDLDLPFNLSLTDEQKRRRGEVPLPYAHEGEGVGIEFGEDEDDDDED